MADKWESAEAAAEMDDVGDAETTMAPSDNDVWLQYQRAIASAEIVGLKMQQSSCQLEPNVQIAKLC